MGLRPLTSRRPASPSADPLSLLHASADKGPLDGIAGNGDDLVNTAHGDGQPSPKRSGTSTPLGDQRHRHLANPFNTLANVNSVGDVDGNNDLHLLARLRHRQPDARDRAAARRRGSALIVGGNTLLRREPRRR
jgi:hypothetical protein